MADLNVLMHVMFLIDLGRPFHNFGAATLNDPSPRVAMDLPLGGTCVSAMLSCERRPCLVGCFMVIVHVSL